MFSNHALELLDRFHSHVVFFITEIDKRPSVCAFLRQKYFNRFFWIRQNRLSGLFATRSAKSQDDREKEGNESASTTGCALAKDQEQDQDQEQDGRDVHTRTGTDAVRSSFPQLTMTPFTARNIAFQMT